MDKPEEEITQAVQEEALPTPPQAPPGESKTEPTESLADRIPALFAAFQAACQEKAEWEAAAKKVLAQKDERIEECRLAYENAMAELSLQATQLARASLSVSYAMPHIPPKRKRTSSRRSRYITKSDRGDVPAKYRNPETGETWCGYGGSPKWMRGETDWSKFLINPAPEGEDVCSLAVKAARRRKELPVVYRNPSTGQTWSGRGAPPLWLRGVSNRERFRVAP